MEGVFEEGFKTFYGAAHALRSVKENTDSGAQCAAGTAFVVDFAPVFGVCTAGEDEVVDDAAIHFGREDGRAILILGCSDEVVGQGDLENASAVRAAAAKASGAPEAVVEYGMVGLAMAAFKRR